VLDVAYPLADSAADNSDTVTMVPVYRGNVVKPAEATLQPEVSWASRSPEDLWCLVMTGLDTHLTQVRTFYEVYVRRELGFPFSEENLSSVEHGTDRNFDLFRKNSVTFAERKTLGIPFRGIPRNL
jgi:hypothetical protein